MDKSYITMGKCFGQSDVPHSKQNIHIQKVCFFVDGTMGFHYKCRNHQGNYSLGRPIWMWRKRGLSVWVQNNSRGSAQILMTFSDSTGIRAINKCLHFGNTVWNLYSVSWELRCALRVRSNAEDPISPRTLSNSRSQLSKSAGHKGAILKSLQGFGREEFTLWRKMLEDKIAARNKGTQKEV